MPFLARRSWLSMPVIVLFLAGLMGGYVSGCSNSSTGTASASAIVTVDNIAPRTPPSMVVPNPPLPPVFDDLQRRGFNYFWETTNPRNGLVPDRWPDPPFASIAAVGFALTVYPIGVERNFISRVQARSRTLATVRFFRDAPQGPEATGNAGYKGFFYHFLDMNTGTRFGQTELSTVDTSLLLGGLLFAQTYFDGADAEETEIRQGVDAIASRVDWAWAQQNHPPRITLGWHPETGFISSDWRGYNESMLVVLMSLASPNKPLDPSVWTDLTASYDATWGRTQGYEYASFQALFIHQFTHLWVDFRGIQDAYIKSKGIDYFENSRRATYAQRAYAISNPMRWKDYGENVWGITACDGPGHLTTLDVNGQLRQFRDYFSRGVGLPDPFDDGTIAPTGAVSSLPFAPELVIPAVQNIYDKFGSIIYSKYGFLESFNTSFNDAKALLSNGQVIPGFGWVDTDYLGIDQGPVVAMIENYRSDFVWRVMRKNPHLQQALRSAGFSGGWLGSN